MTKKELISKIVNISKVAKTDEDLRDYLNSALSLLEPKDRNRFALWGEEKSTPTECWD